MRNLLLLSVVLVATSMSYTTYAQVGIGTTNPQEQLHVVGGDLRVDNLTPTATSGTNVSVDAVGKLILSNNSNRSVSGKVGANGIPIKINGATCFRINQGDYQITFDVPMGDSDYLITLSNYNVLGLTVTASSYDITVNGFKVKTNDDFLTFFGYNVQDVDSNFMFKVENI